ncbi:hypothetical protein DV453_004312 [Geotrichum candidum]|nr:hypothetical protein DV453_004312 [Geotrichum candidum]
MSGVTAIKRAESYLANIAAKNPEFNIFVSQRNQNNVIAEVKTSALDTDKNYVSPFEATTSKLLREAGGTFVGKVNMDEFAMGSNNMISLYGPCKNPLFSPDTPRSAGGSSGGSAAAVAANMCDFALGSDTGGSVRLPAAYCGVVGFKPSYGLISRYGLVAYAQSFDTVGILSRDVATCETVFDLLNQHDSNDPTSLSDQLRDQIRLSVAEKRRDDHKFTIGIVEENNLDLSDEVRQAWIKAVEFLHAQGHKVVTVSIPSVKHSLPTYFILSPSEAASNLARYDGVRFGYRAGTDSDQGVLYAPTRNEGFGDEVRRRIILGNFNLGSDFFGNHYRQAQKVRRRVQHEYNAIFRTPNVLTQGEDVNNILDENVEFERVDVVVGPTSRTTAPTHDEVNNAEASVESYVNDVMTVPANLAGLPAITIPVGLGASTVGIQLTGQFGDDKKVLEVARILERINQQ